MRWILGIVTTLAVLYAGYWFIGAAATERAATQWFNDRAQDGWIAETSAIETRGFPSRFDTTLTDIELADPETGWVWTAPFFQVFALSYRPNHIIAVWPPDHSLASPNARIALSSNDTRASMVFEAGPDLTLQTANFEVAALTLAHSQLGETTIGEGSIALRQTPDMVLSNDLYAQLKTVALPPALRGLLDPAGLLPTAIEGMTIDSTIGFDAPWDRFAIERARPQPTSIDLKLLSASWGPLDLRAAGTLQVDENGVPTGEIGIKARNWRQMLDVAENAGLLPSEILPMVERGLEVLSGLSGNSQTLDVPLSFRNGRMAIGPLPIGPAPRIMLR
ncbi:DUF2125 domain-containing protein [Nereida sp. MMG025]|uniref:DUF2125 domain-containing protein n=1 Tax=Nereida sp. MMG025 TaxID=2909981 RepID=UPI001F39E31A|nr:DUF2125 domain-containing protein [Nereida sp. MMG025]MCF6444120.1 DUF2125 domain-containing protein [Nereida sp. MMG025]